MRDIKFRAWDVEANAMQPVSDLCFVGAKAVTFRYNPVHRKRLQDVYLMQYTGLNDKNGVEIYEGDYVITSGREQDRGVVEFNHTSAWVLAQGSFKVLLHELVYNKWALQVIGNMYENKELLK